MHPFDLSSSNLGELSLGTVQWGSVVEGVVSRTEKACAEDFVEVWTGACHFVRFEVTVELELREGHHLLPWAGMKV